MLTRTAMFVVFMLDETISQGSRKSVNGRSSFLSLLDMD